MFGLARLARAGFNGTTASRHVPASSHMEDEAAYVLLFQKM